MIFIVFVLAEGAVSAVPAAAATGAASLVLLDEEITLAVAFTLLACLLQKGYCCRSLPSHNIDVR